MHKFTLFQLLDRIRAFFKDPNLEQIVVKSIRKRPFAIGWTNSTLIQQGCPKEEIMELYDRMVIKDKVPSPELKKVLGKNVYLKEVTLKFFGTCLDSVSRNDIIDGGMDNSVPYIRNPIDLIKITAGELLRYTVPEVKMQLAYMCLWKLHMK